MRDGGEKTERPDRGGDEGEARWGREPEVEGDEREVRWKRQMEMAEGRSEREEINGQARWRTNCEA